MKTITHILFIIGLLTIQQLSAQKHTAHTVTSKIESELIEGQLTLKATATNNSQSHAELNYLFVSIKKGGSGNLSNNKQSGKFTIKPDETKMLSEINVNIQKNDALKVFLYIKDEQTDTLISKDSLEINSKNFADKIRDVNENKIFELQGLAIDQTKTKTGKDFYDIFYLVYSKIPEKMSSPVTVSELPTMGRGSQISVQVDDKTLYSFIANPNEDYLAEQANFTMKVLIDFYRKSSLLKNEFRY